ncbi:MAG TPA: CapA family protein [Firmicutes bacterium]|nr:CapA family protein [Bacillota bacterium]
MRSKQLLLLIISLVVLVALSSFYLDLPWTTFFTRKQPAGPVEQPVLEDPDDNQDQIPDIRTARLVAVGDIIAHLTQVEQASTGSGYDFSPSFSFITPYLQSADLTVGNFETVLAGPEQGFSGYPNFNSPDELAANLKQAGFDLVATANNHCLDMGIDGLFRTVNSLTGAGLKCFGTYRRPEDRHPLMVEINGINISFIAYTQTTNGIPVPAGHEYAVNFIENFTTIDPIIEDISIARELGADLVVLYIHWGHEYWLSPNELQRNLAPRLAAAGADLIIGSHPHVMQPLEWITVEQEDGSSRQSLVAYSLGNFISNQFYWEPYIPTPKVQYGLVVEVEITKDMHEGLTYISQADYEITWVHRNWRHRILPLSEVLASSRPEEYNMTTEEYQNVQAGFARLKDEVVEKYGFSLVPVGAANN